MRSWKLNTAVVWLGFWGMVLLGACVPSRESRALNQLHKATPTEVPTAAAVQSLGTLVPTPTSEPAPQLGPTREVDQTMVITIVYDNTTYQEALESDWGFSALVDFQDTRVLFDTGARGDLLLRNMDRLGINPAEVDVVVLSHQHQDHTGGLPALLRTGAKPSVVVLPSFSRSYKNQLAEKVPVLESRSDLDLGARFHITGEIPGTPPEQALVLDTTRGLIVITGCAHPGVDRMVLAAKRTFQEDIYLVLGGFHLGGASSDHIRQVVEEFQRLGVVFVAPCHCTGAEAKRIFREAYGDHYLEAGAGKVIEIQN